MSHRWFQYVRHLDSSFGVGMSKLDFFAVVFVHPRTQVAVALAHFIRLKGTAEQPHPLIPDLVWMENVLVDKFGFEPPRYGIVDKCAASLATFAETVKASWSACRNTDGSSVGALKDALDALAAIADGCSQAETTAFASYLADVESTRGTSVPAAAATGVDIAPAVAQAAHDFFGSWATQNPTLVRALAVRLRAELLAAADGVSTADARAGAINAALKRVQSLAWAVADNGSPLSAVFCLLVERWIRLCFFHAKKAIKENVTKQGLIDGSLMPGVWDDEVEPAIGDMFAAPPGDAPGGLDALWTKFQADFGGRFPQLVAYLSEHWMSPEWKLLWTGAGQHDIGHFLITTNNYCENYFRQAKSGPVNAGQMPSDPMEFLEKLIGMPHVPGSVDKSYLMSLCVKISDIVGDTNMRLPSRARITPQRKAVDDILSVAGSVRDIDGAVVFEVATREGLDCLRARRDGAVFHRVNVRHGCTCGLPNAFCEHLIAARVTYLRAGRERCWRDAELCPYTDEFDAPPASAEDLFASIAEGTPPAPPTADGVLVAYDTQMATLKAKVSKLIMALEKVVSSTRPALADDAPQDDVDASALLLRRLARLTVSVHDAARAAETFTGEHSPVAAGGARRFARSARSAAEVAARPNAPLGFRGAVSPSVDFGVRVEAAGGGGAGAGAGAAQRPPERVAPAAGGGAAAAAAPKSLKRAREERALAEAGAEVASLQRKLARAARRIAELERDYDQLMRDHAELEIEAEQNPEFAYSAAYEDSSKRARSVATLYPEQPDARDALEELARGFDRLALSSAAEGMVVRDRAYMKLTAAARNR